MIETAVIITTLLAFLYIHLRIEHRITKVETHISSICDKLDRIQQ